MIPLANETVLFFSTQVLYSVEQPNEILLEVRLNWLLLTATSDEISFHVCCCMYRKYLSAVQ